MYNGDTCDIENIPKMYMINNIYNYTSALVDCNGHSLVNSYLAHTNALTIVVSCGWSVASGKEYSVNRGVY